MGYYKTNRDFHEARWDEPIIMKLGNPGERGILVPKADEKVTKATGTVKTLLPKNLIRKKTPKLPEMSQMQVLRHYMRLSQETIGTDFNIDIGLGTCTMKYSPKIHEQLVRSEKLSEVHPYHNPLIVIYIFLVSDKYLSFVREGKILLHTLCHSISF